MELLSRDQSVITGRQNVEPLHTLHNFPVFFGCVEHAPEQDVRADMCWGICPETGVVQLTRLIPLPVLYQAQHMDGTGATWQDFYEDFAEYISVQAPKSILEIGGGSGALAEAFIRRAPGVVWTMVEPNPTHPASDRIRTIRAFFDASFHTDAQYDAVVFSHTLEHAYDPNEFLRAIAAYLPMGGKLIFAYPQLDVWLSKMYLSALNFEHTMLLTDYFVDYLLRVHGFRILEKHIYRDHSVYYTVERVPCEEQPIPLPPSRYGAYRELFMNFVRYHTQLVEQFNARVHAHGGEVYLFGGHIFSQYLLEFGLREEAIQGILDNSKAKQGKRLYGSRLMVMDPEHLRGRGAVAVILRVGPYREEILRQLRRINSDVVILE